MEIPLTPHWVQPSHPSVQKVLTSNTADFTTKSISLITLPPYAVFAKFSFPPCSTASKPTYATVQIGRDEHMNLNSDLVYINHSCAPSVIFDTSSFSILAGPNGLKAGDELTFFYPSTEWDMAQGFSCFCGAEACRGYISGAKNMRPEQLEGIWLNAHIRALLEERDAQVANNGGAGSAIFGNGAVKHVGGQGGAFVKGVENTKPRGVAESITTRIVAEQPGAVGITTAGETVTLKDVKNAVEVATDTTTDALRDTEDAIRALKVALDKARSVVAGAQKVVDAYKSVHGKSSTGHLDATVFKGANRKNGIGSRELSGEMGGDTKRAV
ncbi:hypothetical protein V8E51_005547 [Hyaloscypha variabilis]